MKRCVKQQLYDVACSVTAYEKALAAYIHALSLLYNAYIQLHGDDKMMKKSVFHTLLEVTQLQKWQWRKQKLLTEHVDPYECESFSDTNITDGMTRLKQATNGMFLSTHDRNELYTLLEENKQLAKKRRLSFYRTRTENDPRTRWLSRHLSKQKQDLTK
ncbi:hypothetical protein [Anoxybacteroides amylolyticum]|uniref:Uncharacterized protein n=1 Tax=Anoxybacteroides amylolyticum TaxID=294699 RepID=A0A160F4J0_9BACL|nr:hypothetical protein [Anoxybacillus amylolyticus]ANB60941.1 hypothetical protein GFC30_2392 [Anoxybacillus amylolyticus]